MSSKLAAPLAVSAKTNVVHSESMGIRRRACRLGSGLLFLFCFLSMSATLWAQQAVMVSPVIGSVLPGPSATFNWTAGGDVSQAYIWVGTSLGGNDLAQAGGAGATSFTANNLPVNGSMVYVRLWSYFGGSDSWLYSDYPYVAATQATMVSPAPGGAWRGPQRRSTGRRAVAFHKPISGLEHRRAAITWRNPAV